MVLVMTKVYLNTEEAVYEIWVLPDLPAEAES